MNTKEITTKEVELPMYIKSPFGTVYHAIMGEDNAICVMDEGVQNCSVKSALHGDYEVITRREFCDKYEQVILNLTNQFDEFMDVVNEMIIDEAYALDEVQDNYTSNEEEGMSHE